MNFKEALIAHFQGKKVEKKSDWSNGWVAFSKGLDEATFSQMVDDEFGRRCAFRLAPRTIKVNGVEVPAPEKKFPRHNQTFYLPQLYNNEFVSSYTWVGNSYNVSALKKGLVHLDRESAVKHAKAMLLHE